MKKFMKSMVISIIIAIGFYGLGKLFGYDVNWVTFVVFFVGMPLSIWYFDSKNNKTYDESDDS